MTKENKQTNQNKKEQILHLLMIIDSRHQMLLGCRYFSFSTSTCIIHTLCLLFVDNIDQADQLDEGCGPRIVVSDLT